MKKYNTLEVMNNAKGTKKVFKTNALRYSEKRGFHSTSGKRWTARAFTYLNDLFELCEWEEVIEPVDFETAYADCKENGTMYDNPHSFITKNEAGYVCIHRKHNHELEVTDTRGLILNNKWTRYDG